MEYTKLYDKGWKYDLLTPYATGNIPLPEHAPHVMHYKQFGNPKGEPLIFIHGGPGGAIPATYTRMFDPKRYRIIMFDQRGCGESTPHVRDDLHGAMAGNITHNLVGDIETLRNHLGIKGKAHIFGGSWGSTLALAYAQAHPEHVQDLTLRGIFLCNHNDLSYFYQGNAATYHENPNRIDLPGAYRAYRTTQADGGIPTHLTDEKLRLAWEEAWHDYVEMIPVEQRGDMIAAYHHLLNSPEVDEATRLKAATVWSKWEDTTSFLSHDLTKLNRLEDPRKVIAFATIENEYFYRALRGQDSTLSALMNPENIAKIAHIPITIVHGKYDQVCTVQSARQLKAALVAAKASSLIYQETNAGHGGIERETHDFTVQTMDNLPFMPKSTSGKKNPLDHAVRPKTGGQIGKI